MIKYRPTGYPNLTISLLCAIVHVVTNITKKYKCLSFLQTLSVYCVPAVSYGLCILESILKPFASQSTNSKTISSVMKVVILM